MQYSIFDNTNIFNTIICSIFNKSNIYQMLCKKKMNILINSNMSEKTGILHNIFLVFDSNQWYEYQINQHKYIEIWRLKYRNYRYRWTCSDSAKGTAGPAEVLLSLFFKSVLLFSSKTSFSKSFFLVPLPLLRSLELPKWRFLRKYGARKIQLYNRAVSTNADNIWMKI
jgi:hypothetical protein